MVARIWIERVMNDDDYHCDIDYDEDNVKNMDDDGDDNNEYNGDFDISEDLSPMIPCKFQF